MEKAKAAASNLLHRSGHKDTSVEERVAPAVQHETHNRHHHEEVQPVVDKAVHQDHYHTTVQPVHHQETLPEQHHHRQLETEQRSFDHGNSADVKSRLESEAAQFKNTRTTGETRETASQAPTLTGEHTHHHVHETIQPVIEKDVHQQHTTHTTVPISETHHNAAKHHNISTLPPVSMSEFSGSGGQLEGRGARYDEFEGAPRYNAESGDQGSAGARYGSTGESGATGSRSSTGHHSSGLTGGSSGSGLTGDRSNTTGTGSGLTGGSSSTGTGSGLTGSHNTTGTGSGLTGSHNTTGTGSGLTGSHNTTGTGSGLTGSHNTTGTGSSGLTGDRSATGNHSTTGSSSTGHNSSSTGPSMTEKLMSKVTGKPPASHNTNTNTNTEY